MKKTNRFAIYNASLLMLISFSIFPATADELYKWIDKSGKVTYQSSPPPEDAAKVEKSKISTGNNDAATEKSAEKELGPIIFYSRPECSSCKTARDYFEKNGLPFEEIDLSANEAELEKLEKKMGYSNVPSFEIGSRYVSGFEKDMLKNILVKEGYNFPPEEEGL